MKKQLTGLFLILVMAISACKKDSQPEIDTEYPEIDITGTNAFPKQCATIKRGETFIFSVILQDNAELGSISIDIHHNFDQHTHSTEVKSCDLDPIKIPENPFLLIQSYDIPENLKVFEIEQEVSVPVGVDLGDYHFMIRLTDKEGWQTIKGLSIKITD
ncbi:DUF4625 domain-containing protein [Albibacterium bauzanense]|uniref:Uncharacterized protein DUF4625 n=1 Tax=Albibacterium bauzanense TaxID=653929 RepID=A0A4R1LRD5_9SPHI|nr:DUF4625 domain-containing protein [Albibacterium bauzanense]TCK80874.1 uncharacterized protein DUF4625 [Albibacterium bauzanense]